tara:strand:+ start:150 stop:572 length:423 start_codon:yes stop_codon:yes gene_type:complete
MTEQPVSGLPFRSLIVAQFSACVLAGFAWFGGTKLLKMEDSITYAGLLESGVIFIVSVTLLAMFSPRKKRPIANLATLWSVTSFVRFFAALGASSLLYYVARFEVRPLLFSFLLNAILLLIFETKIIAQYLTAFTQNKPE